MKRAIVNMGHSARERLKAIAKAGGRDANYVFQRYAFERFYYRIGRSSYADRFILKGAALFTLWMGPMFRVTQDTDLESTLTPDHGQLREVFSQIAQIQVEHDDGVRYDCESMEISDIKAEDEYKGVRIKFNAYIEQARIRLQFDIGFGDSVYPRAVFADYPVLLGGDPPRVRVYPQYSSISEKFGAMVSRGMDNSRLKDYFDIWALSANCQFDLELLKTAVARTFKRNGLELLGEWPTGLTDRFAENAMKNSQWRAFIRKTKPTAKPESLKEAIICIRRFLEPVVFAGTDHGAKWLPAEGRWMREEEEAESS